AAEPAQPSAGRQVARERWGQTPGGAEEPRRALAAAREAGYPSGQARALAMLAMAAAAADDAGEAVRLARQADQVPGDILPWTARVCSWMLTEALMQAGDFAPAQQGRAAPLGPGP